MTWPFLYLHKHINDSYIYHDSSLVYELRRYYAEPEAASWWGMPVLAPDDPVRIRMEAHVYKLNRQCRGRFTMSKWLERFLVDDMGMPAEKVHHVGGGCNIDTSRINTQGRNGKRFLFVGKAWERKNGPLVVEGFKKLHAKYSDTELFIAGPVTCPPEAQNVKGIHFLGLMSHDELLEYFNLCDFFVMPSRMDAYGLVFVEALCFGLPCIGKNIQAMPEFITDHINGRLINDDNPDELADCMEDVLLDGKNYAARVEALHDEYLTRYSWKSVAQRIIDVMRNDGY